MKVYNILYCIFTVAQFGSLASSDLEYDSPFNIKLYHSLEEDRESVWVECGVVTFQNVHLGSFSLTSPPLPLDSKLKLQNLARKNLLYRLKAVVVTFKGKEFTFFTFIRACSLVENDLVDTLTISLDQAGSVIGISLSASDCCYYYPNYDLETLSFNRTVEFKPFEQGPIPDTTTYIQKMEREREAKERGATQDNRSLLAKYWMYIVPVVLFAVLSGSTNVESGNANSR